MKNFNVKIFLITVILLPQFIIAQELIEIYGKKNMNSYFKDEFKGNITHSSFVCAFKDCQGDGKYVFYSFFKNQRLKNKLPITIVICQYSNGKKNGNFEYYRGSYSKKHKRMLLEIYVSYSFIDGLKDGVMKHYIVFDNGQKFPTYQMIEYIEYKKGKKEGLLLYFDKGYLITAKMYKEDFEIEDFKKFDYINLPSQLDSMQTINYLE